METVHNHINNSNNQLWVDLAISSNLKHNNRKIKINLVVVVSNNLSKLSNFNLISVDFNRHNKLNLRYLILVDSNLPRLRGSLETFRIAAPNKIKVYSQTVQWTYQILEVAGVKTTAWVDLLHSQLVRARYNLQVPVTPAVRIRTVDSETSVALPQTKRKMHLEVWSTFDK